MDNIINPVQIEQEQGLRRMRLIATGLLVLMTLIFFVSHIAIEVYQYHWAGFIRAFAEAAMVGAIADWFAVTALFRHPLGLPIPHTAIIPTKREKIARSLGNFVQSNFLSEEALDDRLRNLEIVPWLERWLAVPENSAFIAEQVATIIPATLNSINDNDVRKFIENNVTNRVHAKDVASFTSNALSLIFSQENTKDSKYDQLFNELLRIAERLLNNNKDLIREKIKDASPWFIPDFINKSVSKSVIARAEASFWEVSQDPNHPMRKKFFEGLQKFIKDLRDSPEFIKKIDELKLELLANPVVQDSLDKLWADIKTYILDSLAQPDSPLRQNMKDNIYTFCNNLIRDEHIRQKIATNVYLGLIKLLSQHKESIRSIIEDKINQWDRQTLTRRIELQVGRDLQFIRINGTVVGGVVGLVIYAISKIVTLI